GSDQRYLFFIACVRAQFLDAVLSFLEIFSSNHRINVAGSHEAVGNDVGLILCDFGKARADSDLLGTPLNIVADDPGLQPGKQRAMGGKHPKLPLDTGGGKAVYLL